MDTKKISTYDMDSDYYHNLEEGPRFQGKIPPWEPNPKFTFFDHTLNSHIGIPAGLLLDSKWIQLYAALGYDILVYKTVRTRPYPVHPWPNCLFVKTEMLEPEHLPSTLIAPRKWQPESPKKVTITNSFGMPSREPARWQEDVERALGYLREGQLLVVSGVGTYEDSIPKLVEDFVRVASMIREVGGQGVELNFSCPNTAEGEALIYTDPELAAWITQEVKKGVPDRPLFIKVGYIRDMDLAKLLKAVAPWVEGIVGVNSLCMRVANERSEPALGADRETSGVCGWAIRKCGLTLIREIAELRRKEHYNFVIGGCGGITEPHHVQEYLEAGADIVFTCTGAMFNPYLALEYKRILLPSEAG